MTNVFNYNGYIPRMDPPKSTEYLSSKGINLIDFTPLTQITGPEVQLFKPLPTPIKLSSKLALIKNNVLVIGYYDKNNLSDESYRGVMDHFFPSDNLQFIGYDKLSNVNINNYDAVIVGGGDISNAYFNDAISPFLQNFKGPKIAFSISISSSTFINSKYLGHFDHVFTHNYEYLREMQQLLGSHRAHFIPDITLAYSPTKSINFIESPFTISSITCESWDKHQSCSDKLQSCSDISIKKGTMKKCGVFLAGNIISYPSIIEDISHLVSKLSLTYNIILYCFDSTEDVQISIIVKNSAYKRLDSSVIDDPKVEFLRDLARNSERILIDHRQYTAQEMIDIITDLDFAVCMQYHSHIFCTISEIPFMSISNTRNTKSFMKQVGLSEFQYKIKLNKDPPTGSDLVSLGNDYEAMRNICGRSLHNRPFIKEKLRFYLNQSKFILRSKQASRLLEINRIDIRSGIADFLENTRDYENGARLLSYYVMGYPDSPYIWELSENIRVASNKMQLLSLNDRHSKFTPDSRLLPPLYEEIVKRVPKQVRQRCSEQGPKHVRQQVPKLVSNQICEELSKQVSEKLSKQVSEKLSKQVSEKLSKRGTKNIVSTMNETYYHVQPPNIDSNNQKLTVKLDRSMKNNIKGVVDDGFQYLTQCAAISKDKFLPLFNNIQPNRNKLGENLGEKLLVPLYVDIREYQTCKEGRGGGWYLPCEELYKLNSGNENACLNGIICDMYIDRTFHWCKSYMSYRGIIPYTSPWCGFVHHATETIYSTDNTKSLLEIPEFIQSLCMCVALFTLSEPLSKYLRNGLSVIAPHINVVTFAHPVVQPLITFSYKDILGENNVNNEIQVGGSLSLSPKLINIASWLINPFTIYLLNEIPIKRASLIGKGMIGYLPPKNFRIKYSGKEDEKYASSNNPWPETLRSSWEEEMGSTNIQNKIYLPDPITKWAISLKSLHQGPFCQKWIMFLIKWLVSIGIDVDYYEDNVLYIKDADKVDELNNKILKIIADVEHIECQSNNDYDNLLSENIVFIDLVDNASVYTIIECIVRRTPVIVNKTLETMALLGKNYPLYYTNIDEIHNLVCSDKIIQAHNYILKLDIKRYRIDYFLNQISNIANNL